ncbi:MAG: dihydrodipicolinate synthase family protein [Armatimonadota bacterium]|nr:dihydrodipicolinate synthase family protein [Armatimonadota bacterium]MDR5674933.1 dihydrodipicolinate synthase family protein [Armatimonadota bacterium]MDR5688799.1 dihydrodipicolinate synthase family protein [Armatimonadota bacterium]MDR7387376.1 dihydrodipicolinate synthase family protein [Armatimonadota bacterium]MDR7388688.1 dihydrodipicolinate synthase family protein [Armatimonadota bacterium]
MAVEVLLPQPDRSLAWYRLGPPRSFSRPLHPIRSRVAYAAAHVVADPWREPEEGQCHLDWEATLAYRAYLWSWGLGVAEAMDTAQRGMGLDPATAMELCRRTAEIAHPSDAPVVCGVNTDDLTPGQASLDEVEASYRRQLEWVEAQGAQAVIMSSRALCAAAREPRDYLRIYDRLFRSASRRVLVHWLGEPFDPSLRGYWGYRDPRDALEFFVDLVAEHADRVDGVKVSLLDPEVEVQLRRRLPPSVRVYTGDDFHFVELIRGDGQHISHALLGIFDAIAPAASAALQALDRGDAAAYEEILAPCVPLSRHIFGPPTYRYKTGLVFLAYLNGHQDHFRMVAGMESARSVLHLVEVFVLADRAGLFHDPELAAHRMRAFLRLAGVDA